MLYSLIRPLHWGSLYRISSLRTQHSYLKFTTPDHCKSVVTTIVRSAVSEGYRDHYLTSQRITWILSTCIVLLARSLSHLLDPGLYCIHRWHQNISDFRLGTRCPVAKVAKFNGRRNAAWANPLEQHFVVYRHILCLSLHSQLGS